jgi:hypothetical protein
MKLINGVECYGDLEENSNFEIVCEDEDLDDVWCNGNPSSNSDYTFATWEEVVLVLQTYYPSPIIQITAV